MDKLKLIKTVVVILTLLLIFGTLTLLGLFVHKTRTAQQPLPAEVNLGEPHGSIIKQISNSGETLYMLVIGGGEDDRIIVFDAAGGKKISTLKIN